MVSDFNGNIFSVYSNITDYFSLKKENDLLAEENARLHNKLSNSLYYSDTTQEFQDTLYRFVPAKIVSNSINKPNNFIIIDKGKNDSLQKEMGVISSNGVVGIIIGVSNNYSVVMSLLHQNTRLSARIKKSGQLVNLIWPGIDYHTGKIIDIPSHVHLSPGDTVITSGNSLIFPEGILIGTVQDQEINEGQELGQARLRFSTDFGTLQHVYVIMNKGKKEQTDLLEEINHE